MANRDASLTITVRSGPFQSGMRKLGSVAAQTGRKMGNSLKGPVRAGFKAAKTASADLLSSVKSTAAAAATLGGALSVGGLVKSAVSAEEAYIQLADQLSASTDQAVDQATAQAMVERAVKKSRGSIDEARAALNQLAGAGDLATIEDALSRSALQAKRLGVNTELVARTTSRLLAKGIASSAEEAEVLIERMNTFGRTVLGIDPDEAIDPNDMAEFATFAHRANLKVGASITLLNKAGDAAKDFGQSTEILEELGLNLNTEKGLVALRKAAGMTSKQLNLSKGTMENFLTIMESGSPKAVKAFQDAMGTDASKLAVGEILGKDLSIKIASGKVSKEELRDFGASLRKELETTADNTAMMSRIQETNNKLVESSGARFNEAMNNLQAAFAKPEMIDAINKLAEHLPELANKLAGFLEFVAENPGKSAAGLILAKVGLAFGGAALSTAVAGGMKSLLGSIGTKLGITALAGLGGGAAATTGTAAVVGTTAAATGTAAAAGGTVAAAGGTVAAGGGAAAGLSATGVGAILVGAGLAGAGAGHLMGSEVEDSMSAFERVLDQANKASKSGTMRDQRAALGELKFAQKKLAEEGPSLPTRATSTVLSAFTGGADATELHEANMRNLKSSEMILTKQIERAKAEGKATDAANGLANALAKVRVAANEVATSRGPIDSPAVEPGAAATAP